MAQIRPIYEIAKGWLRVSFPKITAKRGGTWRGSIVEVDVPEGPEYSVGEGPLDWAPGAAWSRLKIAVFWEGEVSQDPGDQRGAGAAGRRCGRRQHEGDHQAIVRTYADARRIVDMQVGDPGPQSKMGH